MAERVGMSRNISSEYLNAVVDCQLQGKTEIEAGDILNELIGTHITNADNIRKTRTILLNIWYRNDPVIQEECISICQRIAKNERLSLHWALLLMAYPVFFDLTSIIGNITSYSDEINATQIKQRIYDKWGARSTLEHSLTKNLQSLKDMDILIPISRAGRYGIKRHTITDPHSVCAICVAILSHSPDGYMTWEAITNHPALFSFEIEHVSQADVAACKYLSLDRMGDQVVIRRI